jgi:tetratricopeptide (TPR) repeat protein
MSCSRGGRRGLRLLAAGTIFTAGGAAFAQAPQFPAGAVVQPIPAPGEGAELRRHLTDLAANPRSLQSLIGAGRAAVGVGDGHAALGFFARAEEIAPQDARVKAGMASAFVLLEQPQAAIRFFAEAVRLGAPEGEIARDRGLAHDMLGDPGRAQQDYALALQQREDAEARRRLALSLAISGNRQAALSALDPLLRGRDRAAFRTRAFVLALTGDANGAAQAVEASLPGQSSAMAPFLARLASLSPAQKAMAVHFGQFPADGRAVRMAEWTDNGSNSGQTQAQQPARATASPARPTQVASRQPAPAQATSVAPIVRRPAQVARAEVPIAQPRQTPSQVQQQPSQPASAPPLETAPVRIAATETQAAPPATRSGPAAAPPAQGRTAPAFDEVAALVRSLPVERDDDRPAAAPAVVRTPRPAPATSAAATGRPAATRTAAATAPARTTRPAAPAHPSRHWVQVAGGSRAAFNFQIGRIRQAASALLQGRQAYYAANGNSSRLLVGPFPTSRAAQDFVNQLARQDVPAFAWTSRAGEEVARLPAR